MTKTDTQKSKDHMIYAGIAAGCVAVFSVVVSYYSIGIDTWIETTYLNIEEMNRVLAIGKDEIAAFGRGATRGQ